MVPVVRQRLSWHLGQSSQGLWASAVPAFPGHSVCSSLCGVPRSSRPFILVWIKPCAYLSIGHGWDPAQQVYYVLKQSPFPLCGSDNSVWEVVTELLHGCLSVVNGYDPCGEFCENMCVFYHRTTVPLDRAHSPVQEEQAASFLVWTCFLNSVYYDLYL